MSGLQIQDLMRTSGVDRWHIVRTPTRQSLAEHTFNVMCLTVAIANKIKWAKGPKARLALVEEAMAHDLDEIWNGDIPTTAKEPKKWTSYICNKAVIAAADQLDALIFIKENCLSGHSFRVFESVNREWKRMLGEIHPTLALCLISGTRTV